MISIKKSNYNGTESHRMHELDGLPLASFMSRAAAFIVDFLIAAAASVPILVFGAELLQRFGRCFADFGLMSDLPRPLGRSGIVARSVAVSNRALTSGSLSVLGDSIQINIVCLPEPRRIFFGSGSAAP